MMKDRGTEAEIEAPAGSEPDELVWFMDRQVIPAAFALLPGQMASREARALLLAIGLQESEFRARHQGGGGPARGFWQFERAGGVAEILTHKTTGPIIRPICEMLRYAPTMQACHAAIEHNDVLAACFARLLLWVDKRSLPTPLEEAKGWRMYVENWRPGKPGPGRWPANFAEGWRCVKGDIG
jgi:hypothetical protein